MQAVHIMNRLPSPMLSQKSRYELVFNSKPDLQELKVFGCLAYASTLTNSHSKLDPRALKCILVGFQSGTKGYILYDLLTCHFLISRNVIFHENIFPLVSDSQTANTDKLVFDTQIYFYDQPSTNNASSFDLNNTAEVSQPVSTSINETPNALVPHKSTCELLESSEASNTSKRFRKAPRYLDQY
jgi:hypothetical protein